MPAAIGVAILTEVGATTLAASATAATVVGYATISGALFALQQVVSALQPSTKRADQQLTVRQAIPARVRGHGRDKIGGAIVFLDESGGVLFRAVVHLVGPLSFIREIWLGDVRTGLTAQNGGVVPNPVYQGKVAIEIYPGTETQAASPALRRFGYWSAAHQLKGLAYSVVVATPLKHGDKIFPEGAPDVRLVADLAACYDPRAPGQDPANPATWAWTDNAALVLLDYLHHESGFGIPFDEIDLAAFRALADVCDEPVPLRVPAADGATTEPRYRSWGVYTYAEERAQVLARYLAAGDFEIDQDGQGRVTVHGGRWHEPRVTITEDMILGWEQFEEGDEAYTTFNRLKFTYKSPPHDYQPVEGDPWDDADAQAAAGVVETERDFGRAPSHSQGRRLAKIAMAKGAPRFRFTGLRLAPAGLRAYGEPTVRLVLPSFGIDATFGVSRGALSGGSMFTTPTLDLYSLAADAYAWSPNEEGNPPPLPDGESPTQPPVPSGAAYTVERYVVDGAVSGLAARFSADAVPGQVDYTLIGRYRPVGADGWDEMASTASGPLAGPLSDGLNYEAELAWISGTAVGAYGAPISFSAIADETPTGPVTGFVVNGGTGQASYAFTSPNTPNFGSAKVYYGATTTFSAATAIRTVNGAPSQAFDGSDNRPAGTHYYWVRAFNRSGFADAASLVGPIAVTVT